MPVSDEKLAELMSWPVPGERQVPIPRPCGRWARAADAERPAATAGAPAVRRLPRPWLDGGLLLLTWAVGCAALLGAAALLVP